MQSATGDQSNKIFTPQTTALFAMGFLAYIGMGIVAPALKTLQDSFEVSSTEIGLFVASFGLARLVCDLPVGMYIDRINRTVLLLAGLIGLSLGAVIAGSAPTDNFLMLVIGRFVMGAGSSFLNMTALVHLTQVTNRDVRGRVVGVYQTFDLAGNFLSPAIGGIITAWWSWHYAFYFCALTTFLAAILVLATRGTRQERPVTPESRPGLRTIFGSPRNSESLISSWGILALNYASFTMFVSGQGFMTTVVPMFGGAALKLGPEVIGGALAVGTGVRVVANLVGAAVSDRFGRLFVLIPALLMLGSASLGLNLVTDLTGYTLMIFFTGFGRIGNSIPPIMLADLLGPTRLGPAIGQNRFLGDIGIMLGPLVMGWIIDSYGFGGTTFVTAGLLWSGAVAVLATIREPAQRGASGSPSQGTLH